MNDSLARDACVIRVENNVNLGEKGRCPGQPRSSWSIFHSCSLPLAGQPASPKSQPIREGFTKMPSRDPQVPVRGRPCGADAIRPIFTFTQLYRDCLHEHFSLPNSFFEIIMNASPRYDLVMVSKFLLLSMQCVHENR